MFILTVTIENIGQKMYKYLSFIQNMFTCNSRVLTKHINMVGFAPVKVSSLLHDLIEGLGLQLTGTDNIPRIFGCVLDKQLLH
jgi:hypothetical protein